jgi:D-aminopeptidase
MEEQNGQRGARARDLGVPFEGTTGRHNAITDVAGVTVGHETIIADLPPDAPGGAGRAVRTGVTAVLPRGRLTITTPVMGAWFSLNGNGELTGAAWIDESGFVEGPILITNTYSVGVVRDATLAWLLREQQAAGLHVLWGLPVVGETWDGWLNDIEGFHVTARHAVAAIDAARPGPVVEGSVGGGTGMICYGFKGGIGTSSRVVATADGTWTIGALLQANFGLRRQLLVAGVPAGRELTSTSKDLDEPPPLEQGSVIVVVATDAPLLPHQLKRLARRVSMGLARTGSVSGNGSGDLFVAFSTANEEACRPASVAQARFLANDRLDALFTAVVEATEEAVLNAMVAGRDTTGTLGRTVPGLPHDRLRDILRRHNRLGPTAIR